MGWASKVLAQTDGAAAGEIAESSASVSEEERPRDGWVLGIGPLAGVPLNNDCTDCSSSGAFGLDMQLGRMLNPGLALILNTHEVGVGRSDVAAGRVSTSSVVQGVAAIALQW